MIKVFRKEIREMEAAPPSRSAMKLFDQKFRRTFTYHDVVCIYQGEFAAFKVDPTEMDMMHAAPTEWIELFPEIEFKRTGFGWMAFPKDLSRGTSIAYLQFGNMAGRLAGNGHTRRYNFEENRWVQGDSIESWVS